MKFCIMTETDVLLKLTNHNPFSPCHHDAWNPLEVHIVQQHSRISRVRSEPVYPTSSPRRRSIKAGLYFHVTTTPSLPASLRTFQCSPSGRNVCLAVLHQNERVVFSRVTSPNNYNICRLSSFLASRVTYASQKEALFETW